MAEASCINLSKTYLQMGSTGKSKEWPANEFWKAAKTGEGMGSPFGFLVAEYRFLSTWIHWERHPKGDELLIAPEGNMELVLDMDGSEKTVSLAAPNSFLIPAGIWHTANVTNSCRVVGVTPGEGSEHRPR